MSGSHFNDSRGQLLLNALCDGSMTAAQWQELDARLREGGAEAQLEYLAFMEMHVELRRQAAQKFDWVTEYTAEEFTELLLECLRHEQAARLAHESTGNWQPHPSVEPISRDDVEAPRRLLRAPWDQADAVARLSSPPRRRKLWSIGAMAAALLLGVLAWQVLTPEDVGRVVALSDVQSDDRHVPVAGSGIRPNTQMQMSQGLMKLSMNDDQALLVVEGPASFTVVDGSHLQLEYGRLTAVNPGAAEHLTVDTPSGRLIDISTEFAIRVDEHGQGVFHVYDGLVRVESDPLNGASAQANASELGQGRAVRRAADGFEPVPLNARSYVRVANFDAAAQFAAREAYRSWRLLHEQLLDDPHLIAYHDFTQHLNDGWVGELDLSSLERRDGRFPGTQAAAFDGSTQPVTLDLPETMTQGSLLAWVRLDGTDTQSFRTLLDSEAGPLGLQWKLTPEARMRMTYDLPAEVDGSRKVIAATDALAPTGRDWHLLAIVFDVAQGHADLYINGELLRRQALVTNEPLRLGRVTVGDSVRGGRSLHGMIDELKVFDRALSSEEVEAFAQLRP